MMKKAKAFITALGWSPGGLIDTAQLRNQFLPPPKQLTLF